MFQNIAAQEVAEKEDVKINNSNTIFSLKGLILCVVSFLVSMVTLKNGLSPFSMAFFVAVCSSSIPAGSIILTTSLGVLAGSGINSFIIYLINIVVFLLSIVIFRPIVQPDKNEISKLGRNLIISMVITYFLKILITHGSTSQYILASVNILLSFAFYKIFVNSFNILDRIEYADDGFASTLEELVAAAVLVIVVCASFAKLGFIGVSLTNIVIMFLIMLFAWKNGPLVGMAVAGSIGLTLGTIGVLEPIQLLIYTIAGVWAGFLGGIGKIPTILTFLLFSIGINCILDVNYINLITMCECLIASVLVLFVPSGIVIPVQDLFRKYVAFEKVTNNKLEAGKTDEERLGKLNKTVNKIAKRYGIEKENIAAEMENISRSKEMFIEDLFKNLDAFPNNILYEELIDTDNGIVDDIYMILTDDNEVTKSDLGKIFEKRNEIIDFNGNSAIREDVEQVVRIINRTYRINEMNFAWKNRLTSNKKKLSKKLKVVTKPVSEIKPEKIVKQEEKMTDLEKNVKMDLKVKALDCKEIKIKQTADKKYYVDILFEKKIEGKDKIKCIENVLTKHCESKIEFLKDTSNISDSLYMQKYISEDKYAITIGISKLLSPRKELSSGTLNLKLLDNKQLIAISDSNEGTKSSKELLNILKHDLASGFNDGDSLEVITSSFENSLEPIKASIDMFVFDLFKGEASYIKMGCNDTYVKLGDRIQKIESEKTIDKELNFDRLKLNKVKTENDMIFVMASRGVLEAHKELVGDKWFEKIIKDANSNNCKKMAEMILERVISNSFEPINKDMYVITIKITNKTKK